MRLGYCNVDTAIDGLTEKLGDREAAAVTFNRLLAIANIECWGNAESQWRLLMAFLASVFPSSPLAPWFALDIESDSDGIGRMREWIKKRQEQTADPLLVAQQLQAAAGF